MKFPALFLPALLIASVAQIQCVDPPPKAALSSPKEFHTVRFIRDENQQRDHECACDFCAFTTKSSDVVQKEASHQAMVEVIADASNPIKMVFGSLYESLYDVSSFVSACANDVYSNGLSWSQRNILRSRACDRFITIMDTQVIPKMNHAKDSASIKVAALNERALPYVRNGRSKLTEKSNSAVNHLVNWNEQVHSFLDNLNERADKAACEKALVAIHQFILNSEMTEELASYILDEITLAQLLKDDAFLAYATSLDSLFEDKESAPVSKPVTLISQMKYYGLTFVSTVLTLLVGFFYYLTDFANECTFLSAGVVVLGITIGLFYRLSIVSVILWLFNVPYLVVCAFFNLIFGDAEELIIFTEDQTLMNKCPKADESNTMMAMAASLIGLEEDEDVPEIEDENQDSAVVLEDKQPESDGQLVAAGDSEEKDTLEAESSSAAFGMLVASALASMLLI